MRKLALAGLCCLLLQTSAHAQLIDSLVNKLFNGSASKPTNQGNAILGDGPTPAASADANSPELQYGTKQALLDAARKGELAGYAKLNRYGSNETKAMVNALGNILAKDYGTPVPNWDGRSTARYSSSHDWCFVNQVKEQMHTILQLVTQAKMQKYSEEPPEFTNSETKDMRPAINAVFNQMRTTCYQTFFGQNKPYPFIDNFGLLMREYAKATAEFVDNHSAELKTQFLAEQAKRAEEERQAAAEREAQEKKFAEEQRQADLERKAQEQRDIEAEHKRVEEQERKAKEIEQKRIAG